MPRSKSFSTSKLRFHASSYRANVARRGGGQREPFFLKSDILEILLALAQPEMCYKGGTESWMHPQKTEILRKIRKHFVWAALLTDRDLYQKVRGLMSLPSIGMKLEGFITPNFAHSRFMTLLGAQKIYQKLFLG